MSSLPIDDPAPAEPYDDALRWKIPSRSDPHVEYVVELNASPGYSICSCTDFEIYFLPLLKRGVSPVSALRAGLVKKRDYHDTEDDVLKCWHVVQAEKSLAKATIRAFSHARSKNVRRSNPQAEG